MASTAANCHASTGDFIASFLSTRRRNDAGSNRHRRAESGRDASATHPSPLPRGETNSDACSDGDEYAGTNSDADAEANRYADPIADANSDAVCRGIIERGERII